MTKFFRLKSYRKILSFLTGTQGNSAGNRQNQLPWWLPEQLRKIECCAQLFKRGFILKGDIAADGMKPRFNIA